MLAMCAHTLACCGATRPADSQPVAVTGLRLRFVDAQRRPVQLSKAELLLVAWGDADRLPLAVQGERLNLDLSPSWLRSRWPRRFADLEKAYLYVQAEGYAPICSLPFHWLGSHEAPKSPGLVLVTIDFRQGVPARLHEGEYAERTIVLHRPRTRRVTLVGDDGKPLAGVRGSVYMFWSASNHCGFLSGAEPLGTFVSDEAGQFTVPDGDFQYALVLQDRRSVFRAPPGPGVTTIIQNLVSPTGAQASTLISFLHPPNTTFGVHQFARRPLVVRVLRDGKPLPQVTLMGSIANCCGACSGPLGTSDAEGRIVVEDFYPEELDELFICGPDDGRVWRLSPRELPVGPLKIELGRDKLRE